MAIVLRRWERRDLSRIALRRPATLQVRGVPVACQLLDISPGGALLSVPDGLEAAAGEEVALRVRLGGEGEAIEMRGAVAHRDASTLGLRCRSVDLEGIAHLRRLLEVNLADDRLLRRELAAVLARRRDG